MLYLDKVQNQVRHCALGHGVERAALSRGWLPEPIVLPGGQQSSTPLSQIWVLGP